MTKSSTNFINENTYENVVIDIFKNLGYRHIYAPGIDRRDFHSPLYEEELLSALKKINANLPEAAINEALYKIKNFENAPLVQKNKLFTDYLQNGIAVQYTEQNESRNEIVYLIDYNNIENNSFIVANQWSFIENSQRRPDILLFINGLPLVLIELKSPSLEETNGSKAYRQIRNYMQEIPSMFIYNAICVISNMSISKAGTITSDENRFMEWKTIDGKYENTEAVQFDTFFKEIFEKKRLIDILQNFICFSGENKILAAYHQYFAVKKAIESTKRAVEENKDGKGGVFWHTQGSGKSLSMVFYAHLLQKVLNSPTIVVLTDRNDLDDQLYKQFCSCREFLRQNPVQATCRKLSKTSATDDIGLKNWLDGRKVNGIIFTTMQKFEESDEPLSQRRNIIVMADEAHRGQYGLSEKIDVKTGAIKHGMARTIRKALPNATYIGFTGTPIALKDRDTREVFGDYIDIYDMTQAVKDGATRPIYYESRLIKLKLNERELRLIDAEYDAMSNGTDPSVIENSKKQLGQIETIRGNENVINSLADDILEHYEKYRADLLTGKAMIVAYSRSIAMKIYLRILELRPSWKDKIALVMTANNDDPENWRPIIGDKRKRDELALKFKDNSDPLKIVIVVDMWLTGFDVPSLATMYLYKPMIGHNLMQAIARVNRVFNDKEGGLIVDYVGIVRALAQAMHDYTERDKQNYGDMNIANTALKEFEEKLQLCRDLLHGYDYSTFTTITDPERSELIKGAVNFIIAREKEKQKEDFIKQAQMLRQALSLCSSIVKEETRVEAAFMEVVRVITVNLMNNGYEESIPLPKLNKRINGLLKQSIKSEGVINLFPGVEDEKVELSLFDPKFLDYLSKMKEKNLAVMLLQKLIKEQISIYRGTNIVKTEKFSSMIQKTMDRYWKDSLENKQAIKELLNIIKQISSSQQEAQNLGLSEEEIPFYDVLTKSQAIKDFYKNDELITMTQELIETLRENKTIDWQKRESERANMRCSVKKILKKHRYPLKGEDLDDVSDMVIKQYEVLQDIE